MIDLFRRRGIPASVAVLAALLVAGCQTNGAGSPTASSGSSAGGSSRAIAFESIDGPPQPVFQKLVSSLSTEADTRNLRVVSREGEANYRVRGYLAASIEDGKGSVDWAWDVFNRSQTRVLRVSGTEQLGKGSDVWARCDDAVLNRIASESLTEIASRLDGKPVPSRSTPVEQPAATEQPAPVPMDNGPPVAALDTGLSPASPPLAYAAQP